MLKVLIDNQPVEVRSSVVVIQDGVTGPVSGASTDILKHTFTPNGTIVQGVFGANTPTTTGVRKSRRTTNAQTIATAANTPG